MKMTIVCESIDEIRLENYEAQVTFGKVTSIDYDFRDIDTLVEMIGVDKILDAIDRDKVLSHFGIFEDED